MSKKSKIFNCFIKIHFKGQLFCIILPNIAHESMLVNNLCCNQPIKIYCAAWVYRGRQLIAIQDELGKMLCPIHSIMA